MKLQNLKIAIAALAVFTAIISLCGMQKAVAQEAKPGTNYIEVSAEADTLIAPDIAYIQISLSEDDGTKRTIESMDRKLDEVLKNLGISKDKNLQLVGMSGFIRSNFFTDKNIRKKVYKLKLQGLKDINKAIMELSNAEFSNFRILSTEYSKEDDIKLVLMTKVMEKAKLMASTYAGALGQQVGKAIIISRHYIPNYGMRSYKLAAVDNFEYQSAKGDMEFGGMKMQLEEIQFVESVNVRFELK